MSLEALRPDIDFSLAMKVLGGSYSNIRLFSWIMRSRDRDHPGQHGETLSLLKIQKISWVWWHMPVTPATWEAEAGELPEPRRRRLR